MKKSCKDIDITDVNTILPFVAECCYAHYKRFDFKKLFLRFGLGLGTYFDAYINNDKSLLDPAIRAIAEHCAKAIADRKLELPPVHIGVKKDSTTGKIRQIGKESALQQCFDYIAVYSCMSIFRRRMVPHQASSIKKRGQLYGTKIIAKWVRKDYEAMQYAKRHNLRYASQCKLFTKLDIKLCYPSAKMEVFMGLLKHDCGNAGIIWLWQELLSSHRVDGYTGFLIGALPSQWATQLMISYIYRHVKSLSYTRRGKRHLCVNHMMCFMDDMLLMSGNYKQLHKAVKSVIQYSKSLGWTVKPTYAIKQLDLEPIDMMGFVVHRDGTVTMRARNFVHSRRMALRFAQKKRYTITQARRMLSYKGYYKYSKCRKVSLVLGVKECFTSAADTVSRYDRRNNNGSNQSKLWRG